MNKTEAYIEFLERINNKSIRLRTLLMEKIYSFFIYLYKLIIRNYNYLNDNFLLMDNLSL